MKRLKQGCWVLIPPGARYLPQPWATLAGGVSYYQSSREFCRHFIKHELGKAGKNWRYARVKLKERKL